MIFEARIIVTHGGAGSIIFALRFHKPTIVVPRLKKFGEHINDHQLELAEKLEGEAKVKMVVNIDDLDEAIHSASRLPLKKPEKPAMINMIKEYISGLT